MHEALGVHAHHGRDQQSEEYFDDQDRVLQLLLIRILRPLLWLGSRILYRVKTAADEDLQRAVENVAARSNHELSERDGGDAENVVGDSKRSECQAQQSHHRDPLARQQAVNGLEIPEDPGRLLYLLRYHLLEQVAGEDE